MSFYNLYKVPKDQSDIVNDRKNNIQNKLRKVLGILVDAPCQGSGNTNDGNTARRFFNNIHIISEITGNNETPV